MRHDFRVEIINVKTSDLRPHPKNVELFGSDPNVDDLLVSIAEVGIKQHLHIDQDNQIVDGVRRWTAATILGMETVPCHRIIYETLLEATADIISFNRTRNKNALQLYNEGKALKWLYAIEASKRKAKTQIKKGRVLPVVEVTSVPTMRTAERVALEIGMKITTWKHLEYVIDRRELYPDIIDNLISGRIVVDKAWKDVRRKEGKLESLVEKQAKFFYLIEGIKDQDLKDRFVRLYTNTENVRRTKEADLRKMLFRLGEVPSDETFEGRWEDTVELMHKKVEEIAFSKDRFRFRTWIDEESGRHYIQAVLWLNEADCVPVLLRKYLPDKKFDNHKQADEWARQRGGWCQGNYSYAGTRKWLIYIKNPEKKEEKVEE